MRCYICQRVLAPDEIRMNRDHQEFDPCGTCLTIIDEVFECHDEEEITEMLEDEQEDYGDEGHGGIANDDFT